LGGCTSQNEERRGAKRDGGGALVPTTRGREEEGAGGCAVAASLGVRVEGWRTVLAWLGRRGGWLVPFGVRARRGVGGT